MLASTSQGFFWYLVPKGYVTIAVCATMPNRTCLERIIGVPLDYGLFIQSKLKYYIVNIF